MIKKYVIFSFIVSFSLEAISQNLDFNTKDTVINWEKYFYKEWIYDNNVKYFECFRKKDSTLYCSYSLVGNKLTGIKNTYNQLGLLYNIETFLNGFHIGTTRQFYSNGNLKWEGSYKYLGSSKVFTDSVCIEMSSGVGEINCTVEKYTSPKEGKWIYYSDNGKKQSEGFYANNRKVGLWLFYDPLKGALIEQKNYK